MASLRIELRYVGLWSMPALVVFLLWAISSVTQSEESIPVECLATPAEDAVFTELDEVWINPPNGDSPAA